MAVYSDVSEDPEAPEEFFFNLKKASGVYQENKAGGGGKSPRAGGGKSPRAGGGKSPRTKSAVNIDYLGFADQGGDNRKQSVENIRKASLDYNDNRGSMKSSNVNKNPDDIRRSMNGKMKKIKEK